MVKLNFTQNITAMSEAAHQIGQKDATGKMSNRTVIATKTGKVSEGKKQGKVLEFLTTVASHIPLLKSHVKTSNPKIVTAAFINYVGAHQKEAEKSDDLRGKANDIFQALLGLVKEKDKPDFESKFQDALPTFGGKGGLYEEKGTGGAGGAEGEEEI